MAQVAIIVNGMPGSGKTTLGTSLAEVLGCPFLSKDRIKEPLADVAGPMIPSRQLGGIAMDTVWAMAAAVENGVVIDAVWVGDDRTEFLRRGLETAGAPRVVEVWCDVDRDTVEQRLTERYADSSPGRHPVHGDLAAVRAFWDEHEGVAGPTGICPVVRVDTTGSFDVPELVQEIAAHFG